MAQYEEQNPLDYRVGGDTVDDFAQKYKKEISRIYQFLNNLREHNSTGPNQVEPQPYIFKISDNKLFIRNGANNAWLYLFDIAYRMGLSDNPDAEIITSDDVTTTAEALKLVKTNADGDIDANITGNAYKFGNKTADQYITVYDVSDAGVALKIVKTDSEGVAHISISGSAVQLNGKAASYYLNEDDVAIVPAGTVTDAPNKLVKTNANGVLPVDILGNVGKMAGKNIEVNNLQDGQVFTYRSASNSWRNEDKGVVGAGKALAIYDGDDLLAEYSGDEPKSIDLATTAINNRIDLVNGIVGRETTVSLGSTAMLPNIPPSYYLECTTPGTTGATAPVVSSVTAGDTITDGSVVWTVRQVLPTSGGQLEAGNVVIAKKDLSGQIVIIGGTVRSTGASLTLKGMSNDATTGQFRLKTVNNVNQSHELVGSSPLSGGTLTWDGNDLAGSAIVAKQIAGYLGYRKTADGFLMQWGKISIAGSGVYDITYPISFENGQEIQFFCSISALSNGGTPSGTAVRTLSTTYPDSISNPVGTSVYINSINGTFYILSWLAVSKG